MKLFEPGKIGNMELKNRIVMSGMATQYLEEDGGVSQTGIDYFEARAKGGVGLIITSAARTRVIEKVPGKTLVKLMTVDNKEHASRLCELAKVVHGYGTKIAVQLTGGRGRNIHTEALRAIGAVAPSPLPCFADPKIIAREITTEEIEKLLKALQFSAELVRDVGIDAIEINAHGGYIIDEFMTSLWNKRTDKYGGNLEGRLTFLMEIIQAIRAGAGKDHPLLVKYPISHFLEGARTVEEGVEIGKRLEAAGVDGLDIDAGCYETMYWFCPPTTLPPGCTVEYVAKLKKVVNIPVIIVGKLGYPAVAERVLQEGKADFIAIGKALLADADWANKVKEGKLDDIRPCIGDEEGCLGKAVYGEPITCTVNPAVGKEVEYSIKPAARKKSVLVIGGGPGGMEAAMIAAMKGHDVTLWEKGHSLGGNLRLSAVPDFKQDYRLLVDYLGRKVRQHGVKIKFGFEATPELVQAFKPDVVMIAGGGNLVTPDIPGKDGKNVFSSLQVLAMLNGLLKWGEIKQQGLSKLLWFGGNRFSRYMSPARIERFARIWFPLGHKVVIIGATYAGCEMALFLKERGREVTIVESLGPDNVAREMFLCNRMHLLKLLGENKVNILTDTKPLKINEQGVLLADKNGKESTLSADSIMLSVEIKPNDALLKALKGKVPEVFAIGDCVEPRKALGAIHDGFLAARQV